MAKRKQQPEEQLIEPQLLKTEQDIERKESKKEIKQVGEWVPTATNILKL
jgi:hypothetical protein